MEANYRLEFTDYLAAQKLHLRKHRVARLLLWFWTLVLPAFGLLMLIATLQRPPDTSLRSPIAAYLPSLWLLSLAILLPLLRRYNFRKQFKQMFPRGSQDHACYLIANDEHLVSGIHGASEGRFLWTSLFEVVSDDKLMLIYVAKKRFLFVPLSKIDVGSRDELVALALSKIGTGQC